MVRKGRVLNGTNLLVLALLLALAALWYSGDGMSAGNFGTSSGALASELEEREAGGLEQIERDQLNGHDSAIDNGMGIQLSLVRVGELAGGVSGSVLGEGENGGLSQWHLQEGQRGMSLVIPRGRSRVQLEDGWTAVPAIIPGLFDSVVRIYRTPKHTFRFTRKGSPVSPAVVSIMAGKDFTWSGQTNESGAIAPPSLPPGPVHILLQTMDLCASWSAPFGYGHQPREVALEANLKEPRERLLFLDRDTQLPVEGVQLRWAGWTGVGVSSGFDGVVGVPPRNAGIDVLEAVADGYKKKVISLSEDVSPFLLSRAEKFRVAVKSEDGRLIAGASCIVVPVEGEMDMRILGELEASKTDENGLCEVWGEPGIDGVFVYHDKFGSGVFALEKESGATASPHEVVLRPSPLRLHFDGWMPYGDGIKATTILGDTPAWTRGEGNTIVFHHALLLDRLDLSGANNSASLRRSPQFQSIRAIFRDERLEAVSGSLEVVSTQTGNVQGRTVDFRSEERPWSVFQLQPVRFHRVSQNLKLYPGYQGYEPSSLAGWVYERNGADLNVSSDASGSFRLESVPFGEYVVRHVVPDGSAFSTPFGTEGYQSSIYLSGRDEVFIQVPNQKFLDLSLFDLSTQKPLTGATLEVTYESFLGGNLRTMRREFYNNEIRTWVSWYPGVKIRVCAFGYEPISVRIDSIRAGTKLNLRSIAPMELDFGTVWNPKEEYQVIFLRPPGSDGFREALGSQLVPLGGDGIARVNAPFPGAIISIREVSTIKEADPVTVETQFVSGGYFKVE